MTTLSQEKKTPEQIQAVPDPDGGPGAERRRPWLFYTLLVLLTLIFIAPLLYMASTSFKTPEDAISTVPQWFPAHPTLQAYERVLTDPSSPVGRWFLNSLVAATANSLLAVSTATLAGYSLARIPFKGRQALFVLIVATLFLPPVVLLAQLPDPELPGLARHAARRHHPRGSRRFRRLLHAAVLHRPAQGTGGVGLP